MKRAGGELEVKYCLKRQSWRKYLRQTVKFLKLFYEIALYEKSSNSIFQEFFASIDKILILGSKTEHEATIHEVLTSSSYFLISSGPKTEIVWRLVRQLVFTLFITNNHDSFHLRWQEHFVKHQNVSKYYGQDCLKKFILHFRS